MAKFSEETLNAWRMPPSTNEETRLQNAESLVRQAIADDPKLSKMDIKIFGQGSYANDTNVKLNSDIDINVRYNDIFYYDLPEGTSKADFSIVDAAPYSSDGFKKDVEAALVRKFGRNEVKNFDKCLTIVETPTRGEVDVVPTFVHRRYSANKRYVEGVQFYSNKGFKITNFPVQHIENGINKNANTRKRFKRLTRIFRKIRYKMIEDGVNVSDNITSFLLECLVWNVPNQYINNDEGWTARLRESIIYLYQNTTEDAKCSEWGEVSELLYLFRGRRKWKREDVNTYMQQMWTYLKF